MKTRNQAIIWLNTPFGFRTSALCKKDEERSSFEEQSRSSTPWFSSFSDAQQFTHLHHTSQSKATPYLEHIDSHQPRAIPPHLSDTTIDDQTIDHQAQARPEGS